MPEDWSAIWNERSPERADWNGYEACFVDRASYDNFNSDIVTFIAHILRVGPNDVVADLGCGTGLTAYAIADRALSVLALDYSHVALDVARKRRVRTNLRYEWADLNSVDLDLLRPVNKAYAIGSFLYLNSRTTAFQLVDKLITNGTELLLTDLPDRSLPDTRKRNYDTTCFRHLQFDQSEFTSMFPSAEVTIHRNLSPGYINDSVRFSVHMRPT